MPSGATTIAEALAILGELRRRGATGRLLGGLGVAVRCPSAHAGAPLSRTYGDLDLAITRSSAPAVAEVIEAAGYAPAKRFNAAHGRTRLLFTDAGGRHVDVFIGTFAMCHVLPLERRLGIHEQTLSLADLLLTKLQIAQLNRKDVTDAAALLADHGFSVDEDAINIEYVAGLLADDWGWWRTVTDNVHTIVDRIGDSGVPAVIAGRVRQAGGELLQRADEKPKSLRWRMRAKIGDRLPWRDEPEEIGAT